MGEKWREVYTEEQIKKIQELEIQNLKVVDYVCKKIGIEYFLYGGSLIGAVRHHGFIPWDDDLDIAMMRADYNRFVREAPVLLPKEYYLQTPYSDKKTPYLYTKLRLKGTKYVEYAHHRISMEQGIYVDIYPIDNIPDDDNELLVAHREYIKLVKRYVLRQSPYPSVEGKSFKRRFRNIVRYALSTLYKLVPQQWFVKKAEAIMTQFNGIETERKGNLFYPEPKNLFINIFPFENGMFEGISVKLPGNWDAHLKSRYGDYWVYPPEAERIGHKPYILDFGDK